MFEKTFESLLKGADAKSDPKTVFPHARKIDYHSRGMQYYNAEKEFMQLATDVGAQMQSNVSQLGLTKNHLQPFLNDVFVRKPKRQVDKSALNEEARMGFVDLFTRMNSYWDNSECKKNATALFDIKGEGDKDGHGAEGRGNLSRENRKNLLLRVVSKDSANEDAISPIYDPAKSPYRKAFGTNLTVEAFKGGRVSGEPTPILNKEDSFDTSANFHAFKPPQSLTQIIASRDTLDDDHKEDDRQEKLEKILKDKTEKENKTKEKAIDREEEKEVEKQRQEEEITNKKVEVWMNAIPDFSYLFSQEIVEPKSTS